MLLFAAVVLTTTIHAQVINGDMNHNTVLDADDITQVIDGYLTGLTEVVGPEIDHYYVDYNILAGTWYRSKTDCFTLNPNGTTDYGKGYTFKFLPSQGYIIFYNAGGRAVNYLKVLFLPHDKSYLIVTTPDSKTVQTYFNRPIQPVESIKLTCTSLYLQLDSDPVNIFATVSPIDADNTSVEWVSSDEDVVTISNRGTVEVVGEGSATIFCTAHDGLGATAVCEVTVGAKTRTTYTVNGVSFKMVSIEGGTFKMGAQGDSKSYFNYDSEAEPQESPVHNVTLSDFQLGETEVTQALWEAVMGSNPCEDWIGDNIPMYYTGRESAQTFIEKLNQLTGQNFRLPTEAEWEFAARGGNKSQGYKYSGNDAIDGVAWYWGNSDNKPHEVRTKLPNELGLYDMSGNVWEVCQDNYRHYSSGDQFNPICTEGTLGEVIRGGSFKYSPSYCRVSYRYPRIDYGSGHSFVFVGFRLAQ